MQLPNFGAHNKQVYIGLIIGGIALGLYLRHRSASGQTAAGTDANGNMTDTPNMPNVDSNGDPYSGTSTVDPNGSIPGPAGPPGPRGPRGPRGHNGGHKNQHHGNNSGGHAGNGGATRHHKHKRTGGSAGVPILVTGTVVSNQPVR